MQIPVIYYLIESYKKENFNIKKKKAPLCLILYYLIVIYLSTMISVYASILCWESTKGSLLIRLMYATFANIFSIFYLAYHFIKTH